MFCLARELGVSVTEVLQMSALEIGLWRAISKIETKGHADRQATAELRSHVQAGLTDIKGKLKHGNSRSHSR